MAVEESVLLLDPYKEEEEEEETLSLCDLPFYSTTATSDRDHSVSAEWKGRKEEEENDNELFEFFSEEFTRSTFGGAHAAGKNIMFCGKLIPFKDNDDMNSAKSRSMGNKVSLVRSATKSRWFLFMFGMSSKLSINSEMELRDIRKRQSRRVAAPVMFPAAEGGKGKRKLGIWKLLKSNIAMVLGCSNGSKVAKDVLVYHA